MCRIDYSFSNYLFLFSDFFMICWFGCKRFCEIDIKFDFADGVSAERCRLIGDLDIANVYIKMQK